MFAEPQPPSPTSANREQQLSDEPYLHPSLLAMQPAATPPVGFRLTVAPCRSLSNDPSLVLAAHATIIDTSIVTILAVVSSNTRLSG